MKASFKESISHFKLRFHIDFIGQLMRRMLVAALISILIFYFLTKQVLESLYAEPAPAVDHIKESLFFILMTEGGLIALVVGMSIFAFIIVKSNAVAGPIYRLEQVFELVSKGDFTNVVKFRDNDAYEIIESDANASLSRLNDEFAHLANYIKKIK